MQRIRLTFPQYEENNFNTQSLFYKWKQNYENGSLIQI